MKYAIIAAAILLAATSVADAKQWGRGNRPAPGIGRCGYNIALDCKGAKRPAVSPTVKAGPGSQPVELLLARQPA
jgi:hypothetical protein